MTTEIKALLKKISTAKGITVLLIVFFLSVFIWKNLNFLTQVSFTFKNESAQSSSKQETKNKNKGVAQMDFGNIFIPPSPKKLPAIVVFEIKNDGSAIAKNARINIDLGASKVIGYEVIGPKQNDVSGSEIGSSMLNIDLKLIRPHESAYIYIQVSTPTFKKVAISSDSTAGVKDITLGEYLETGSDRSTPTFQGFLLFLLGGFILTISVYFTIVLLSKLNKLLKME
ncbi:MAG: hypothetical protein FXF49_10025 [Flexistipes sinusarabici]|uniref:Uncharacterized protein n=1 Tax=Flexistipes sinusarabici TaxID=2352 RepID=A0A5D0MM93_FLESI|nr:hypothetical protein [Flexistipes sinusarabici]TYB32723.1 MAG: hypothetical protein FXF49_10025 [Flexistipes sinusarabici]